MRKINILLIVRPAMLATMLRNLIGQQADMELVGEVPGKKKLA